MKPEKTSETTASGEQKFSRHQDPNKHESSGFAANDECFELTLSEVFNDEIDAWARHAMARNGFG